MTFRTASRTLLAPLAIALLTAGGCYSYLGVPRSKDAFTYESTALMPATVSVIDARTGGVLWSVDVPVDQKLVVRFYDNRRADGGSESLPAMMRWEIGDLNEAIGSLANEVPVPHARSRKLNYEIREGGEFADSELYPADGNVPVTAPEFTPLPPESGRPATGSSNQPPELEPIIVDEDD